MKKTDTNQKALEAQLQEHLPAADERTTQISNQGMATCGVIAIFYIVFRVIYVGTVQKELAVPELVLLFLMTLAIAITNRVNKLYTLPEVFGKPLNPAPEALGGRLLRYALSAMPLVVSWTVLDMLTGVTDWGSPLKTVCMDIAILFTITFLFELIRSELQIKQYNKAMQAMESDENDLED